MPNQRVGATMEEGEKKPSVLRGMGSPGALAVLFVIFGPVLFVCGHGSQRLLPTALASFSGALAGVAYQFYKPLNPLSDNFYASKPLTRLTLGELRALGYLNGSAGHAVALKAAVFTAWIPIFGALVWQLGIHIPPVKKNWEAYPPLLAPILGLCAIVSLTNYSCLLCWTLSQRWDWIVKNQPLPSRRILRKYSKNDRQLKALERRMAAGIGEAGPERPIDQDWVDALEGRLTWNHVAMIANLMAGGVALISVLRLLSGSVTPGREMGALLLFVSAALVWFATLRRER